MEYAPKYPSQESFSFPVISHAVHYAVLFPKCLKYLSVSTSYNYTQEVISYSGLRASPENIMGEAFIKKQEDVGIREEQRSDERNIPVTSGDVSLKSYWCMCVWRGFFRQ